jgi:hypothetical protein
MKEINSQSLNLPFNKLGTSDPLLDLLGIRQGSIGTKRLVKTRTEVVEAQWV